MSDLYQLLARMKKEADRIQAEDKDLSIEQVYEKAITLVFMSTAESLHITPHEARLLDTLNTLSPSEEDDPVSTNRLCIEIGSNYFALRHHLINLEAKGIINRPRGERSGWKVALT